VHEEEIYPVRGGRIFTFYVAAAAAVPTAAAAATHFLQSKQYAGASSPVRPQYHIHSGVSIIQPAPTRLITTGHYAKGFTSTEHAVYLLSTTASCPTAGANAGNTTGTNTSADTGIDTNSSNYADSNSSVIKHQPVPLQSLGGLPLASTTLPTTPANCRATANTLATNPQNNSNNQTVGGNCKVTANLATPLTIRTYVLDQPSPPTADPAMALIPTSHIAQPKQAGTHLQANRHLKHAGPCAGITMATEHKGNISIAASINDARCPCV